MTKPKLFVPQHIWDGKAVEKQIKEMLYFQMDIKVKKECVYHQEL